MRQNCLLLGGERYIVFGAEKRLAEKILMLICMLSVILAKNLGMLAFQIRKLQKYWGLVLLWLIS